AERLGLRIDRKADVTPDTAHEIAAFVRSSECAGQWNVGPHIRQSSVTPEPNAGDRLQAARAALLVDGVLVQQHLNLDLPSPPRVAVGASRKIGINGASDRGV